MPNSRAACRWLIPSTWQARRTRAYRSTTFIPQAFRSPLRRKARQRANFAPPQPDYPAASVRDFLSAALNLPVHHDFGFEAGPVDMATLTAGFGTPWMATLADTGNGRDAILSIETDSGLIDT